jgi:hypothetical protein
MVDTSTEPRGLFIKPSGEVVVRYPGGMLITCQVGAYRCEPPEHELIEACDEDEYNRLIANKNA